MPLRAKTVYSASICYYILCSAMLYGSETCPVRKKDVIRLGKNDARMVRWRNLVRSEDRISAKEPRTRLNRTTYRNVYRIEAYNGLLS